MSYSKAVNPSVGSLRAGYCLTLLLTALAAQRDGLTGECRCASISFKHSLRIPFLSVTGCTLSAVFICSHLLFRDVFAAADPWVVTCLVRASCTNQALPLSRHCSRSLRS